MAPTKKTNGLQVPYVVKKYNGGKGVFASKAIAKGTLVRKIILKINTRGFKGPKDVRKFLVRIKSIKEKIDWVNRCFFVSGKLHEITDDSQYIKHDNGTNVNISRGRGKDNLNTYAVKSIKADEEIIADYSSYRWPSWVIKMCNSLHLKIDHFPEKLNPGISGFQVKYKLQESKYGLGIFADEEIKRGCLIWKYKRGVNIRVISTSRQGEQKLRKYLATFPSYQLRKDLLVHMYCLGGYCNEILDDCQFWNHSDTPNTSHTNQGSNPFDGYALRNIKKGEELLEDYRTLEWPKWYLQILSEYDVDVSYFTILDKNKDVNMADNNIIKSKSQ